VVVHKVVKLCNSQRLFSFLQGADCRLVHAWHRRHLWNPSVTGVSCTTSSRLCMFCRAQWSSTIGSNRPARWYWYIFHAPAPVSQSGTPSIPAITDWNTPAFVSLSQSSSYWTTCDVWSVPDTKQACCRVCIGYSSHQSDA